MRFLRTNTAVMVTVGPFYDKTDGVTIETALTITNERITLTADTDASSAPTNILDNVTGATSGTANDLNYITGNDAGMMQLELAAADTNRLGRMMLSITDAANHVPVFHEFMVLPAMIYDAFVLGTDVLDASMTQILGTAVSSPATAGILDVNVKNIDNDAASASGTVTFPNATLASTVNITAAAGCAVSSIGNNVLTAASTSADYLAEINAEVDTAIADVGLTTTITGRIDAAITTRASQTSLDTVDDFLDTEVAAIKAKTDNLPSDPADASDVAGAFATVNTKLDTIDDFLDTEIAAITSKLNGVVIAQGTIGATGNDTTHIHLTGLPYGDDEINNHLLVIFDVSASEYHARWITDWADTGDLATVATLPFTPQNSTDTYWLLPIRQDVTGGSGLDAAGVRAAVGLSSANLDTQLSAIDDFIDTEVAAIKSKTDNLPSDPADASDIAALFAALSAGALFVIRQNTAQAGGASTITLDASASATDDKYQDSAITIIAGTGVGQCRVISSYDGTSKEATVSEPWLINPDNTSVFKIEPLFPASAGGGGGLDAAGVRAAVGLATANLDDQLSAIDNFIDTEVAAIKAKTDNLPSDPADASDIAGAFSTLSAKVDVIDDFLDTEVAAIKAKTDQFTFTTANRVDAQVFGIQANAITAASTAADYLAEINAEVDTAIADVGLTTTITGRIDAAITTRASQTSVDTIDDFLDTEVGLILAAVDTEVAAIKAVTDLFVTAHAEPTGTPAANATPLVKLAWLFMALRNQVDVTASKKQFYDDGGSVEWEKDLSDDGTTFTESEANAP